MTNGTILRGQVQRPTPWERRTKRGASGYFLPPRLTAALLAWAVLPRPGPAVSSALTHKTWLMPSVLAKLTMSNWDTVGLIS